MRIQLLIASTLAALGSACPSTWNCDPPSENYEIDAALTQADVTEIIDSYGFATREEITCEIACTYAYQRDQGWVASSPTACTFSITPNPGEDADAQIGSVQCEGTGYEYFCEGRRPLGHVAAESDGRSLGAYLGRCAHLEAASVAAFEELAAALEAAGAPLRLVSRCRCAAADERRHAALVGALARDRGVEVPPAERRPTTPTLAEIAIDNAREGCVLETWAALRAAWIAEHAEDPEIRRVYSELAADEAEHAQLSWDLHAWLKGQISQERSDAAESLLRASLETLPALALAQSEVSPPTLGIPPMLARTLAQRFAAGLAAAA